MDGKLFGDYLLDGKYNNLWDAKEYGVKYKTEGEIKNGYITIDGETTDPFKVDGGIVKRVDDEIYKKVQELRSNSNEDGGDTTEGGNDGQIITLDVDIKEEDIIRDYKNKKYNIGKFVYDKKNDEFKIKSKYPFLLKRTNGVVENMRTTFWETLSKWYDYPLTANNTSLEVVNNKKFKVTTK